MAQVICGEREAPEGCLIHAQRDWTSVCDGKRPDYFYIGNNRAARIIFPIPIDVTKKCPVPLGNFYSEILILIMLHSKLNFLFLCLFPLLESVHGDDPLSTEPVPVDKDVVDADKVLDPALPRGLLKNFVCDGKRPVS